MINWFKKKRLSNKIAEMEKLRNQEGVYTFGNFEGSSDAKNLELDQISFFPDSEQIFQNTLSGELMPICSFDLNLIHQDLNGIASFVHVYREYGEYASDKWYNEYCKDYLLTFEQVGAVQLKLLGDEELFGCSDSYKKYKERAKEDYNKAKASYRENVNSFFKEPLNKTIRQLGSKPFWVQGDETPQIEGVRFIGQMDSGQFIEDGPYLFLFVDPSTNRLYQIEQFT